MSGVSPRFGSDVEHKKVGGRQTYLDRNYERTAVFQLPSAEREGIQDLLTYEGRAQEAGTRDLLQVKSRSASSGTITA